ncbi:hypothetical protein [Bosea psychrotolerans]|uniref:Uncharacterized protein n=1 Tax=Bosea psychrotolerans TaxID=1871628 RepID=A0A2S4MQM9_9HYPH|nr:hypothetical protein [Bosea psychrotolerans]POR57044.1 hypothetical protein CYD53_101569 [Bosea psychrotolerans]
MTTDTEERAKAQSEGLQDGGRVPPMRADDHSDADPAVETPVEARQGFLGKPVLLVLAVALILSAMAGILVGAFPS